MNIKELLIKQTSEAFEGEMSLMSALVDLTQEEASWRLNDKTWTIEEIIYHVASCKIEYCKQGFGKWRADYPKPIGDIDNMLRLLAEAQDHLVDCLLSCSLEDLDRPINTRFHGQSAGHFFWIMIMHDISHGAQIGMIRRAFGTGTDFYPV
jgi:uncharacterized damage-inducible protein DinB